KRVARDLDQGVSWSDSLRRRRLIQSVDQAVLQAAERVGNLPWALRETADSNRRRMAYRLNAIMQLAFPPIILCLGAAVMVVILAFFYPLIYLIYGLVNI
ncbi:MAG: type II secretion system F family protein, partial [Thermoguttaceae bacterium]